MQTRDTVLSSAEFDPRLETYFMLQAQFVLLCTVAGVLLMPFWYLLARGVHRKQYEGLGCELTARALNVRRGFIFKIQQHIPLDKITDLAVYEGPLLRALGLCSMRIETAGGGQAGALGHAFLPGVKNLDVFRERVLAQRDAIVLGAEGGSEILDDGVRGRANKGHAAVGDDAALRELRDSVLRIERLMVSKHQ
jgi:putative membrane protein